MTLLDGIFGVPHGVLSSRAEWLALAIGAVALVAAWLYDGDLDVRPVSGAAVVGVLLSLAASAAAPPAVADEWHVPVLVVLALVVGVAYARRRTTS